MGCFSKYAFCAVPYKATILTDLHLFGSLYGPVFSSISMLILALETVESAEAYSLVQT